jgi:hypothetical protein
MNGKKITVELHLTISGVLENIPENDCDTIKYLVEEDLNKAGWEIEECTYFPKNSGES